MGRIYPICSSSGGNSTFIGTRGGGILIDAGCSFRALKAALELIDTSVDNIEALFITHEHIDHIRGLLQLIKHTKIPVFTSAGTIKALRKTVKEPVPADISLYDIISDGYKSADFEVSAFRTSHDAAGSVGYSVNYRGRKLAVCTDTGVVTEETEQAVIGSEIVLLESNYDPSMLAKNLSYPPDLKRRIAGKYGHLSNNDAALFAEKLVRSGTTRLILGHLSRENNTPATAERCTVGHLESKGFIRERDFTLDIAPVMTEGRYIAF